MSVAELIDDLFNNWITDDGLCRLDPNDNRIATPPSTLNSVSNANGILYLAYAVALIHKLKHGKSFQLVGRSHGIEYALLNIKESYGLFNRWPKDSTVLDSHDNFIGQIAISVLTNDDVHFGMRDYGRHNSWCYNNVNPGKWDWAAWRQPGDVAFLEAMCLDKPSWFKWIWFLVGSIITLNSTRVYSFNLLWLKLFLLQSRETSMGFFRRMTFKALVWYYNRKVPYPDMYFKRYFRPDHPIAKMAALIDKL